MKNNKNKNRCNELYFDCFNAKNLKFWQDFYDKKYPKKKIKFERRGVMAVAKCKSQKLIHESLNDLAELNDLANVYFWKTDKNIIFFKIFFLKFAGIFSSKIKNKAKSLEFDVISLQKLVYNFN